MFGIKKTQYTVLNNEEGQTWKERFLKTNDVICIQEDESIITIIVGEFFDIKRGE